MVLKNYIYVQKQSKYIALQTNSARSLDKNLNRVIIKTSLNRFVVNSIIRATEQRCTCFVTPLFLFSRVIHSLDPSKTGKLKIF